jgi:hypothetical protein
MTHWLRLLLQLLCIALGANIIQDEEESGAYASFV